MFTLTIEDRIEQGKGASRRLRKSDKIPAIIYGGEERPMVIAFNRHKIEKLLVKLENCLSSDKTTRDSVKYAQISAINAEISRLSFPSMDVLIRQQLEGALQTAKKSDEKAIALTSFFTTVEAQIKDLLESLLEISNKLAVLCESFSENLKNDIIIKNQNLVNNIKKTLILLQAKHLFGTYFLAKNKDTVATIIEKHVQPASLTAILHHLALPDTEFNAQLNFDSKLAKAHKVALCPQLEKTLRENYVMFSLLSKVQTYVTHQEFDNIFSILLNTENDVQKNSALLSQALVTLKESAGAAGLEIIKQKVSCVQRKVKQYENRESMKAEASLVVENSILSLLTKILTETAKKISANEKQLCDSLCNMMKKLEKAEETVLVALEMEQTSDKKSADSDLNTIKVSIQAVQRHPFKAKIMHIDFMYMPA